MSLPDVLGLDKQPLALPESVLLDNRCPHFEQEVLRVELANMCILVFAFYLRFVDVHKPLAGLYNSSQPVNEFLVHFDVQVQRISQYFWNFKGVPQLLGNFGLREQHQRAGFAILIHLLLSDSQNGEHFWDKNYLFVFEQFPEDIFFLDFCELQQVEDLAHHMQFQAVIAVEIQALKVYHAALLLHNLPEFLELLLKRVDFLIVLVQKQVQVLEGDDLPLYTKSQHDEGSFLEPEVVVDFVQEVCELISIEFFPFEGKNCFGDGGQCMFVGKESVLDAFSDALELLFLGGGEGRRLAVPHRVILYNNDQLMKYDSTDPKLLGFFKDQKLKEHIVQQLDLAQKYQPRVKISQDKLSIYCDVEITNQQKDKETALFLVTVTRSYPLRPPRVYLLNEFIIPRINDYQDLLESILRTKWFYMFTLDTIFTKLEQFCFAGKKLEERPLELQRVGKYHPGQRVTSQELDQFQFQRFQVVEKGKSNQKKVLGVSQFHILIWGYNGNCLELELAGAIQSVKEISVSRQGEIILKIRKFQNLKQSSIITKNLLFSNNELQNQFVRTLLKNITPLQSIRISIDNRNDPSNQIINKQLKNIKSKEEQLSKNPKNKQAHNILTQLYQQIIDYYSLRGDYFYLVYVYKMNNLFKLGQSA